MSEMILNEITEIRISDIVTDDRIRDDLPEIESLAQSIEKGGLLQYITVNANNMKLVAGGRRLAAYKLLGRETIPGMLRDLSDEEARLLEIRENNQRVDFNFSQKVAITKLLRSNAGEKRGRKKAQDVENNTDKKNQIFGMQNSEIAVEAGWSNEEAMRKAIAIDNNAIDEIKDGLNKKLYSLDYAFKGCQLPRKKQLTWHNEAVRDSGTDISSLNKDNESRRKAKRKTKTKTPLTHKPHPIFRIIRIAPDWDNIIPSDILELPVADYADPKLSVCIVEVSARHIPHALDCLHAWDYDYTSIVTIYNGKRAAEHLPYTTGETAHLVIGTRRELGGDESEFVTFGNLRKLSPVVERYATHLEGALLPLIGELFPDRKSDRRIDMTSTEPVKNFVVWKLTYGDPDATTPDDSDPVRATDPVAPVEPDIDTTDPVAPVEPDVDTTDPVDPEIADDEITFEPDDEPAIATPGGNLKLFDDED